MGSTAADLNVSKPSLLTVFVPTLYLTPEEHNKCIKI